MVDGVLPLRFSNDFLKRIGIMTPQGGRALLYRLINNPKVSETEKEKYSLLWDVLEGASRGKRTASTSLARLLNIRENHAVDSTIVQDELVFDAAPVGKYPPVIECTGKMGRKFKCRAVANQPGAHYIFLSRGRRWQRLYRSRRQQSSRAGRRHG